mmetsp:Transcript_31308/g.55026  ORF Transcript_31308/g.55026 Transcript_31308/m.55026 type:complete len:366 (+) Transcript_31308:1-1098(+)
MNNFVNGAISAVKLGLTGYFTIFPKLWISILQTFRAMMGDYYNFFSRSMDNFVNKAIGAVNIGLRGYFKIFPELWISTLQGFRAMMKDYYYFFSNTMNNFVNGAISAIKLGLTGYFTIFPKLWTSILQTFRGMMQDYYGFFSSTMNNFVDKAIGAVDIGLKGYFRIFPQIWMSTLSTVRSIMQDNFAFLSRIAGLSSNFFVSTVPLLKSVVTAYLTAATKIAKWVISGNTTIVRLWAQMSVKLTGSIVGLLSSSVQIIAQSVLGGIRMYLNLIRFCVKSVVDIANGVMKLLNHVVFSMSLRGILDDYWKHEENMNGYHHHSRHNRSHEGHRERENQDSHHHRHHHHHHHKKEKMNGQNHLVVTSG